MYACVRSPTVRGGLDSLEARRADMRNHAGPSDLRIYFRLPYHDLTVVAISLRPFGPRQFTRVALAYARASETAIILKVAGWNYFADL